TAGRAVSRDDPTRHGVLTALAEAIRRRGRHGGLADAGRPEDRDYGRRLGAHATRASKRSSPASVVLVAESMRTCTSSPGEAAPSKLTVLLWRMRPRSRDGSVRDGPSTSTSISRPTKRWARSVALR